MGRWDTSHSTVRAAPRHPSPRTTSPHARAGSHGGERVWAPQNIGLNTSAENRTGQVKISLQSSISHAEEHWATLLRARAGRAARHGRNELHARRGGARESVGSAEARVRPSKCPSSALAARARATGNIGLPHQHTTAQSYLHPTFPHFAALAHGKSLWLYT